MNLRRILIWIGLMTILIGCLVPVLKLNGTYYLFLSGRYWGGSTDVLFALLVAFAALAMKKYEMLWVFGLIFLAWFIDDFRLTWQRISDLQDAYLFWGGWLLLFNGALFLLITLLLGEDREKISGFFASLDPEAPFREDDEDDAFEDSDEDQDPATVE
jgi:hypothetical protein